MRKNMGKDMYNNNVIKIRHFMLLLLACLGLSACNRHPIIHVVLHDAAGISYPLNNYPGKWIVINYWASWCEPCYEEIPQLNAFYRHHHTQVLLFGVNYEHLEARQLAALATKMQISYPVLASDPAAIFAIGDVPNLPATYIINPEGKVVKTLYGKQTEKSLSLALNLPN